MSAPDLVIFGCLTLDNVVTAKGECLPQTFGGNCLYAALAARLWCERVGVVSRAGENYPEAAFDLLHRREIDVAGIRRMAGPHGRNMAFAYRPDGSRTRVIPPELIARLPAAERDRFVDTTLLPDARERWLAFAPDPADVPGLWWESLSGAHCAFMPVLRHRQIAATLRARRGGAAWLQIDSPWHDAGDPDTDHTIALFPLLDSVLPSEVDLEKYRPGAAFEDTVRDLLQRGARRIVLKRGGAGCSVFEAGRGLVAEIPALPVAAVDPTGAGDAFCGGFLAGLRLTGDVIAASRHGTVAASFAVEAPGVARLVDATPAEVARRLAAIAG